MKEITLYVPDNAQVEEQELKRFMAAKMYEAGRLSIAQAAAMAELSSSTFAEVLADYGVSIINYSESEVLADASRI